MATARVFQDGSYALFAPESDDDVCPWVAYTENGAAIGARWSAATVRDATPTVMPAPAPAAFPVATAASRSRENIPPRAASTAPPEGGHVPVEADQDVARRPEGKGPVPRRFFPGDRCPSDVEAVQAPGRTIWSRPEWDGEMALVNGWQQLLEQAGVVVEVPVGELERYVTPPAGHDYAAPR